MNYLKFDDRELVNLEYSLSLEMLSTNRAGGYTSTTIVGCNTRKYHGLMICPIDEFGGERHVLLSSLDETIVQHEQAFNLAIHKYPGGAYEPRGHKYIIDFKYDPTPTLTYRIGGVILKKELITVHNEEQILIRYTLLDVHSPTLIRLKPMLAFRNIHELSKANMYVNIQYKDVENGVASKLYTGYPYLNMQLNKKNEFIPVPDWYYNVEYSEELKRGYDGHEDLYSPGYFETSIKKGESIIFSASLKDVNPKTLSRKFNSELKSRPPKQTYADCLKNSAEQFIVKRDKRTFIVAGYHWFGVRSRDMLLSLPGLTLSLKKDLKTCKAILDSVSEYLKDGLFPEILDVDSFEYHSVDTPLWYFWAIQKYARASGDKATIWKDYGKKMKSILNAYRDGLNPGILMHENGLIWAEERGKPKTWMNAVVDGKPVTPRYGYTVEVNALWYNAVCFALESAEKYDDKSFVEEWKEMPEKIKAAFMPVFWMPEKRHLADYSGHDGQNQRIRPNELIAAWLPYSPIDDEVKVDILNAIEHDLLTPKGIRTLSPKNPVYKGMYEGTRSERDAARYQGTVWVWLLAGYVEAKFRLHGSEFVPKAKRLFKSFEQDMISRCICSIPEMYNGDPPHAPRGAVSQAWSVAAALVIKELIETYE